MTRFNVICWVEPQYNYTQKVCHTNAAILFMSGIQYGYTHLPLMLSQSGRTCHFVRNITEASHSGW
jgi:hypothetical protein